MRRLGIVGHRELDPETTAFVGAQSIALIDSERAACGDIVAVSALAEGADTLFAEAAVGLGVQLEIVRPFDSYEDDFRTEASRSRYTALVDAAHRETRLSFVSCSLHAYEAAMRWVADACDLLVAVWDGSPPGVGAERRLRSGMPRASGDRVVHFDVVAHRVVRREAAAR